VGDVVCSWGDGRTQKSHRVNGSQRSVEQGRWDSPSPRRGFPHRNPPSRNPLPGTAVERGGEGRGRRKGEGGVSGGRQCAVSETESTFKWRVCTCVRAIHSRERKRMAGSHDANVLLEMGTKLGQHTSALVPSRV
jgi:hypothetical protein